MKILVRLALVFVVVFVGGVAVFLANWEIPAPVQPVEKVISNGRFAR